MLVLVLSLFRGVIAINATVSFELHPEEEKGDGDEEGSGEMEEGWMHVIYPTNTQTSEQPGDCGVSHTSIPPIQIIPQTHRVSELCVRVYEFYSESIHKYRGVYCRYSVR